MCIGMPMQVVEPDGSFAWCEADGQRERLDMTLVGDAARGHLGAGLPRRGTPGAERRRKPRRPVPARQALAAVLRGDGRIDDFFADLVDREPELPAHLCPPSRQRGR